VDRYGLEDIDGSPDLAAAWDDAVDRTHGIDAFCSSTDWSFAAAGCMDPDLQPVVAGDGDGFCGLSGGALADGTRVLLGLDPVWGFASPVVGEPDAAAAAVVALLASQPWDAAVLTGQDRHLPVTRAVVQALGDRHDLYVGPSEARLRAAAAAAAVMTATRPFSRMPHSTPAGLTPGQGVGADS